MARKKAPAPNLLGSNDTGKSGQIVYHRNHTTAEIAEAEAWCRRHDLALAKWLKVDETKIGPADRALAARVLATTTGDGTGYDKALAHPEVNRLFATGALFFARPL